MASEEHRMKLTAFDLEVLCQGDEVLREGVHVILDDAGLDTILTFVRRGLTEAARRLREKAGEEDACPSCRGTRRVPVGGKSGGGHRNPIGTVPCPLCTRRFDEAHGADHDGYSMKSGQL